MRTGLGFTVPHLGGAFDPTSISGLVGWWDASDTATITESGGSVSQWDDKSGNSRHGTQGTAASQWTTGADTINGKNVLTSGSGIRYVTIDMSGVTTTYFTMFAVYAVRTSQPAYGLTGGDFSYPSPYLPYSDSATTISSYQVPGNGGPSAGATFSMGPTALQPVLWRYQTNSSGANVRWRKSDENVTGSSSFTPLSETWSATFQLGNAYARESPGYLCEWFASSADLSAGDISAAEDYLGAAWGIY